MTAVERLEGWQDVANGLERMLRADSRHLGIMAQHDLWKALGLIQGRLAWLEGEH